MNWSQISKEIPLSLVIISHRKWDGGKDGMVKKGGGSQTSVTLSMYSQSRPDRFCLRRDVHPFLTILGEKLDALSLYSKEEGPIYGMISLFGYQLFHGLLYLQKGPIGEVKGPATSRRTSLLVSHLLQALRHI